MDSLIGVIPDDWRVQRLRAVCPILVGPSAMKSTVVTNYVSGDVPIVTPRDLRHNRIADQCVTGVPREIAAGFARYRLLPKDIVCARTGHLDRHGLVEQNQRGWLIGSAC